MSMSKVLELARADLGYTEKPPGSNRTKYWDSYDPKMQGQPWCVSCQWDWFNRAGERMAFFGGGKTASCGTLLRWYREQGLTVPVSEVQVGDIVILNFSGTVEPQHCGMVTHVERSGGSILYIKTIEGNTTSGDTSQDNGGMVCEKVRYPRQVVGVCRPQYNPEEPKPVVPDYNGRWSEAYWEEGIRRGIITEAKNGKYRPTDTATREEVLAMILRNDEYNRKNG